MCSIDDCVPWTVRTETNPRALKDYLCRECGRVIHAGERYNKVIGLCEGEWETHRTCRHCTALSSFMNVMCGGYPIGELRDELVEHWRDGYASIQLGRWIACMRLGWHDGDDPEPVDAGGLAKRLLDQAA